MICQKKKKENIKGYQISENPNGPMCNENPSIPTSSYNKRAKKVLYCPTVTISDTLTKVVKS